MQRVLEAGRPWKCSARRQVQPCDQTWAGLALGSHADPLQVTFGHR